MTHDDESNIPQRIVITIDLPRDPATHTIAAAALQHLLGQLEYIQMRPTRTTLEITETTTPPAPPPTKPGPEATP